MQNNHDPVELHPAYQWDCPHCGSEMFERGLIPEMSDDELEMLKEQLGVGYEDEGDIMMMPGEVRCNNCGEQFNTVRQGEE